MQRELGTLPALIIDPNTSKKPKINRLLTKKLQTLTLWYEKSPFRNFFYARPARTLSWKDALLILVHNPQKITK